MAAVIITAAPGAARRCFIDSAYQHIAADFPEEQVPHIAVLLGKITALEALVDMLWTNELAKTDDPESEAEELKETALNLVRYDEEDPVQERALDSLSVRLESILHRLRSF